MSSKETIIELKKEVEQFQMLYGRAMDCLIQSAKDIEKLKKRIEHLETNLNITCLGNGGGKGLDTSLPNPHLSYYDESYWELLL